MNSAEKFSVHESPAWRERSNYIINARLPEAGRFEQLWSRRIADDTFELCCIPFFLYDVALGDIVRTKEFEGRTFVLDEVLEPSGRYVFRAHFERSSPTREQIGERLAELDAMMEWSSPTLLAIDAPDLPHAQSVANFLGEREELGQLIYETGKTT